MKKLLRRPILLVDGDLFLYQAVANCVEERTDDGDEWYSQVNVDDAVAEVTAKIDEWRDGLKADGVVLAFGCSRSTCWRRFVFPEYKSNRPDRKPVGYAAAKQRLMDRWEWRSMPSLEADDVIGLMHTKDLGRTVAVSDDKDFGQLPGLWLRPRSAPPDGKLEPTVVLPAEADKFHMTQTLTGDAADGYPGCKGVGPAGAEKALAGCLTARSMWRAVVDAFKSKGHDEAFALTQARVARILRSGEATKDGRVKLWRPGR